jgi:hypothetical protein
MQKVVQFLASLINFAPTGNVTATNVQSAIAQNDSRITTLDEQNVKLSGNQTITGNKTFSNTTASTSTTTGALVVSGGVGVGGNGNFGGNISANSVITNGRAYIVSASKPTLRAGGSSLVSGDRWLNTTDNILWTWNGTYWLWRQPPRGYGNTNSRPDPLDTSWAFPINYGIFLHSISWAVLIGSVNDNSNYYTVAPRIQVTQPPSAGTSITLTTFSTQNQLPNTFYQVTNTVNVAYLLTGSIIPWITTAPTLTTVGSPTINGHSRFTFDYSLIFP